MSRIDLDIREIRILSSLNVLPFARMVYRLGSNVVKPRDSDNDPYELISLNGIALSTTRSQADPYFTYFMTFFNQKNYAANTIKTIFDGQSKWTVPSQRAEALVLTSAFQIVFMETLSYLQNAIARCGQVDSMVGFVPDSDTDRHPLDNAAALIIGSLEGTQVGGSFAVDGELVWNLANKRAFQFKTMNDEEFALVNQELIDLLYTAKGEMDGGACDKLSTTIDKIVRFMQVGIVQSIVEAAVESQNLDIHSTDLSLVQGEVLSYSILPIMAAHDAATAIFIEENMKITDGVDTVRDGAQAVADGLGSYVTQTMNLPCSFVGATNGANPCAKYGSSAPTLQSTRNTVVVACLTGLVALLI
jgi:hypothetical protein